MKKILKVALIAVVVAFVLAAAAGILFGTKTQEDLDRERAEAAQQAQVQEEAESEPQAVVEEKAEEPKVEEAAQIFEGDSATAEYVGTQDAAGNAVVTFSVTNGTDRTVMVSGENVVVNGQYAVQALGGSTVPIGPGLTGAVSLSFGVSVQTPLGGTSDMETLAADLVLRDNDTFDVLGSVPVSVTL